MCYLQLCLQGSSKVMILETLPALLDIPPKSRFETDQILKMKFKPICIYSAIFWPSSTFPLALVCVVITVEKQSRHFSSFADLLWNDELARFKSLKNQVEEVSSEYYVWSASHLLEVLTMETNENTQNVNCSYLQYMLSWFDVFVIVWDRI